MTQLTTLIGQHYGLSRQNLEQAVAQIMGMQRDHTEGMANLIFGATVRMSDALQVQAPEIARMKPPARDAGAEAGTQTAPDLTAGTTPGSASQAAASSSSGGVIGSAD